MYTVSVFFGEALELIGYDLIFNREEEVQVRTYWQAHVALPADLRPTLYLLDKQSAYLGATDDDHLPATLVWFPTQQAGVTCSHFIYRNQPHNVCTYLST